MEILQMRNEMCTVERDICEIELKGKKAKNAQQVLKQQQSGCQQKGHDFSYIVKTLNAGLESAEKEIVALGENIS